MAGRPPLSIATKLQQGDTRKLGANKFSDSLKGTFEPQRGRPKMPAFLNARKGDDHKTRERLRFAREHWKYVADQLENEGKLALLDQGILAGISMVLAEMAQMFRSGESIEKISHRYEQFSDRMGLNESARARIPASASGDADLDPFKENLGPRLQTA